MNQKFISENFCENKAVENSKCNGTCYLVKEMDKHSDEDSKSTLPKLKVEDYIIHSSAEAICSLFFEKEVDSFSVYQPFYHSGYKGAIFHPPLFVIS